MGHILYKLAGAAAMSAVWTIGASASGHDGQSNSWQSDRGSPSGYSQSQHQSQNDKAPNYSGKSDYQKPVEYKQPVKQDNYKSQNSSHDTNYGKTDNYQGNQKDNKTQNYQPAKVYQADSHQNYQQPVERTSYKPVVKYDTAKVDNNYRDIKNGERGNDYRPVVYSNHDAVKDNYGRGNAKVVYDKVGRSDDHQYGNNGRDYDKNYQKYAKKDYHPVVYQKHDSDHMNYRADNNRNDNYWANYRAVAYRYPTYWTVSYSTNYCNPVHRVSYAKVHHQKVQVHKAYVVKTSCSKVHEVSCGYAVHQGNRWCGAMFGSSYRA